MPPHSAALQTPPATVGHRREASDHHLASDHHVASCPPAHLTIQAAPPCAASHPSNPIERLHANLNLCAGLLLVDLRLRASLEGPKVSRGSTTSPIERQKRQVGAALRPEDLGTHGSFLRKTRGPGRTYGCERARHTATLPTKIFARRLQNGRYAAPYTVKSVRLPPASSPRHLTHR